MRGFLKNMGLLIVAGIVALAALEGISRLAYPVQYGHKSYDLNGAPIYPATDMTGVVPSLTYRQKTQEFDIITTHTARGYRGPIGGFMDVSDPDVVFLGDSMTYGIGVADDQTIPYIYCKTKNITCANLGRPGIGTKEAIAILDRRLKEGWTPGMVILIMNVMSSAQFGGNDLTDNVTAAQTEADTATAAADAPGEVISTEPSLVEQYVPAKYIPQIKPITHRDILDNSNLARVGYYVLAPMIRRVFSPGFAKTQLQDALDITQSHLVTFDDLSEQYGFAQRIFLVHPMQDLSRGTWHETERAIAGLTDMRVISTAPALLDTKNPEEYYYPLDGHVRPEGAAKIAAFMVEKN